MRKLVSILIIGIVNLKSASLTMANEILPTLNSTADQQILEINATIKLQEISLKNSVADYLIFQVQTNQTEVNLKGLQFYDDKVFKTITENFLVKNGQQIKLTFNSDATDSNNQLALFTKHKGLTGTTEQIIIKSSSTYFDFFCWQKSPISKSENTEWEKIWQAGYWDDADIEDCFESEKISKDQSLFRNGQENNSSAWEIIEATTEDTENDNPKKSTKTSSSTIQIDNESTPPELPDLRISEIFPAPPTGEEEWIELENLTDQPINLAGWIIDDQDGGSKPKALPPIILPAAGFLQIKLKQLKINLNNSSDQIRIFLPTGQIIDAQEYEEIEKNKSYALISIDGEKNWQYTDIPTPGKRNQSLNKIAGTIIEGAQFEQLYHFTITPLIDQIEQHSPDQISQHPEKIPNKILVIFDEKIIKGPLAKTTFTAGVSGEFTGEISPALTNTNDYQSILKLSNYQITFTPEQSNSPPITLIGIIVLVGAGLYASVKIYRSHYQKQTA